MAVPSPMLMPCGQGKEWKEEKETTIIIGKRADSVNSAPDRGCGVSPQNGRRMAAGAAAEWAVAAGRRHHLEETIVGQCSLQRLHLWDLERRHREPKLAGIPP